jgi:cytochrome P450
MTLLGRALRKALRIARGVAVIRRAGAKLKSGPLHPATVDLDAPEVARDPFPAYDALRAIGPVQFLPRHDAWFIFGYAELRAAFAMPQLLSNHPYEDVDAVLLGADPPQHTAIRRIASRYFSRQIIESIAVTAREGARELLPRNRTLEVVSEFAEPLSQLVAARLIGFDGETMRAVRAAGAHFDDFPTYVAALRSLAHRAAIFEGLRSDGLDDAQARSLTALFWVASVKTTERTIVACAYRLAADPELYRGLQRDPAAIGKFIDEVLRLHQPEPMLRRRTSAPVELDGATIPAGAMVYLCLAAANRDPAAFDEPHALRLDRGGGSHLSFGHGIHYCIGAVLARVVVDAAVRELLSGEGDLKMAKPADGLRWHGSMMVHFIERLLISIGERESP